MTKRRGFVPVLAFVAALAALSGCKREAPITKPAVDAGAHGLKIAPTLLESGRVKTERVTRKAATGVVRLAADVVSSPEGLAEAGTLASGRIAKFEAREGDSVRAGQVLAWLDSPEAARAMADLLRARARTETQTRKVARLQGLVVQEAATQLALEDAQLELDTARADLAASRTLTASLGLGEPTGDALSARVPIRSPVDGVIVERTAALGAHVTPEMHLFRIVHEGGVLVEARLPDGANVVLPPGSSAEIDQRGVAVCNAKLLGTLPEVNLATRTRRVRLIPENGCKALVPGAQAEVRIAVPSSAARDGTGDGGAAGELVTRASAVVEARSTSIVFVKTGPDAFEVRPVEPGLRIGDDRVLLSGVNEGDEVVVEGAVLLKGELLRSELGSE